MPAMISYSVGYTAIDASGTTVTVAPPPAYQSGDLLVMGVMAGGESNTLVTASTPSGWTALSSGSAPGVFVKTATSSEPDDYTVTVSATSTISAFVAAYPAATVVSSAFQASDADIVSYSPAFPSGVTSGEAVLLIAGAVAYDSDDSENPAWQNLNLPSGSWTTEVPVFGQFLPDPSPYVYPCCIGMCDITGSTSAPALTSPQGCTVYAAYVVLNLTGTSNPQSVSATVAYPEGLPGMALTVKALSGAATVAAILAGGATEPFYANATSQAPATAIIPNATGSLVYGAVTENVGVTGGTTFTPSGASTFSQNIGDDAWDAIYGTFRSTGTTTEGTPVTLGGSAPDNGYTTAALAEILAAPGQTLTETATAIAAGTVPGDFATTTVTQTAIFPVAPAPGSLLVAMVSANSNNNGNASVTIEDSSSLTWIPLAEQVYPGYSGVWVAFVPNPTAALTVTPSFTSAQTATTSAALTVTPSFTAADAVGTSAALTVTPSFSAPRYGGIPLMQETSGSTTGTSLTLTFPNPLSGNSVILALAGYYGGAMTAVTIGGTEVTFTKVATSTWYNVEIWLATGVGELSQTLVVTASEAGIVGYGYEVAGSAVVLDQASGAFASTGATSWNSGTTAETIPYEHFAVGLGATFGNTGTITPTASGWNNQASYTGVTGEETFGAVAGYREPTEAGTYFYSGTTADSDGWGSAVAVFLTLVSDTSPSVYPIQPGWGGYVFDEHPSYTGISATFTIPPCAGGQSVSIWVGLGNVYQTGIYYSYDTSSPDNVDTWCWTEMLPGGGYEWLAGSYPTAVGDTLVLSMELTATQWLMTIQNVTEGWTFTDVKSVSSVNIGSIFNNGAGPPKWIFPLTSAEVIVEDENHAECPNYGTIAFTEITTTPAATQVPYPIVTVNAEIAQYPGPFTLEDGTGSFDMVWNSYN
jgi:hypothetical protein